LKTITIYPLSSPFPLSLSLFHCGASIVLSVDTGVHCFSSTLPHPLFLSFSRRSLHFSSPLLLSPSRADRCARPSARHGLPQQPLVARLRHVLCGRYRPGRLRQRREKEREREREREREGETSVPHPLFSLLSSSPLLLSRPRRRPPNVQPLRGGHCHPALPPLCKELLPRLR